MVLPAPIVDDIDTDLMRVAWSLWVSEDQKSRYFVNKNRYLHRVVMERVLGRKLDSDEFVGFDNRDTFDCRRQNLVVRDRSHKSAAQKMRDDNTSGYRGVVWQEKRQKWKAQIKGMWLGDFIDAEEAARAYDAKAVELYGSHAQLNFEE